jgi:hypothetical protein
MPQKIVEVAEKVWTDYVEPIGRVGLTLFGVTIGVKVGYTALSAVVNAVFCVQLPPLPY